MGDYIPTNEGSSYRDEFRGGFEAYLTAGLNKIGDPVESHQKYKLMGKGSSARIRPVTSGTTNPNARPVGKRQLGQGKFYQGGKHHGKTRSQVIEEARRFYAKQPDSWKKQWEQKAQGMDIRSEREKEIIRKKYNR